MLLLLQAAEEAAEPSKTPFYILASCLVAFALILSAVGTARHETFPPTQGIATRHHAGWRVARGGNDVHRGHHGVTRVSPPSRHNGG